MKCQVTLEIEYENVGGTKKPEESIGLQVLECMGNSVVIGDEVEILLNTVEIIETKEV